MPSLVTFGEIMARIEPPPPLRFAQALPGVANFSFAGAEANVAAAYALLGGEAAFVTALPHGPVADACVAYLRGVGLDISRILRRPVGRLGIFYLETGSCQRPSAVFYDRAGSTISLLGPEQYDWPALLRGARWLHVSGITPALSSAAAGSSLECVRRAKAAGLRVSLDLNFRKKLWDWKPGVSARDLARSVVGEMLPYVDLVVGNEEDADDVLGIKAGASSAAAGHLETERYPEVARRIAERYSNVSMVAFTLRESISATHNDWGAMLWTRADDAGRFAPMRDGRYQPYPITDIVDRVGAGDSFAGSLLYALEDRELSGDPGKCVAFAAAASCLCHTIRGDFNFVSRAEVLSLMGGDTSGRVRR
ncbi:MAG TPA: sugar kinase [Anaeromyxobacter sp.]|nr:sugar kinase [Anaeromyxobacter sp.]